MNPGDRVTITCKPNSNHHHPEIREKRAAMNGKTGEVVTIATLSGDVLVEADGVRSWFWASELTPAPSVEADLRATIAGLRDELANEKAAHLRTALDAFEAPPTTAPLAQALDLLRRVRSVLYNVGVVRSNVDAEIDALLAGTPVVESRRSPEGVITGDPTRAVAVLTVRCHGEEQKREFPKVPFGRVNFFAPPTPDLDALRARRDALRAKISSDGGDRPMSPPVALIRELAEVEAQIEAAKDATPDAPHTHPLSPEDEARGFVPAWTADKPHTMAAPSKRPKTHALKARLAGVTCPSCGAPLALCECPTNRG